MASTNVKVLTAEHVTTTTTTTTTVLSTVTVITSSFPHTSVIFSPQQGPRLRSSTGSNVRSTHMRLKASPEDKTVAEPTIPNVSITDDVGHSPKSNLTTPDKTVAEPIIPNVSITEDVGHSPESNLTTPDLSSEPNIINLNFVEDVEAWIKSGGVYVGRKVDNHKLKHEGSKWGNPHPLQVHKCRKKVVELFRVGIMEDEELLKEIGELKGKVLGCWCAPHECHAVVLHELAGNVPIYDMHESLITTQVSPPQSTSSSLGMEDTVTPGMNEPAKCLTNITPDMNDLAKYFTNMEAHMQYQNEKISQLEERISNLEGDLIQTKARFVVRDHVIEGLRGEIHRLQQYTRRYSVTVAGIDKEKGEEPEDLREKVLQLVTDVKSTTTEQDIDKFHRNGRLDGKEQEIIIRFKSHSAKEAFYKARKTLPPSRKSVKIRPSLSNNQINLLRDAISVVEDFSLDEEVVNPVEFVFANIHGQIQAKMKEKVRGSPFISFNTIPDLVRKLQEAQVVKEEETAFDEISSWADMSTSKRVSTHQSRPQDSENDDMGFGLFA